MSIRVRTVLFVGLPLWSVPWCRVIDFKSRACQLLRLHLSEDSRRCRPCPCAPLETHSWERGFSSQIAAPLEQQPQSSQSPSRCRSRRLCTAWPVTTVVRLCTFTPQPQHWNDGMSLVAQRRHTQSASLPNALLSARRALWPTAHRQNLHCQFLCFTPTI
jgi:hypothetical protein